MTETSPSPRPTYVEGVECVVADPLRFKAKLAIGENAYTSLRTVGKLRELWDVLGAAGTGAGIAKSSLVAAAFFAPEGLLGVLGIGTAATPIGWVALAAIASGGACYGFYRLLGNTRGTRVIEIPRYLNTPLDTLGLALFDLLAPMAIRMAAVDGTFSPTERERLVQHLVQDWGLDQAFVVAAIHSVEQNAVKGSLEEMAQEAAVFLHSNPDCNHAAITKEYVEFLRDLLESDGAINADEHNALKVLSDRLATAPASAVTQHWLDVKAQAGAVTEHLTGAIKDAAQWTREQIPTPAIASIEPTRVLGGIQDFASAAVRKVGESFGRASRPVRGLIGRITGRP